MSSKPPKSGAKPTSDREARLKAALKANLGRRKQQARVRGTGKNAGENAPNTDADKG